MEALSRGEDARAAGADVHRDLIAPLHDWLAAIDTLVIVPDATTSTVPFAAIPLPNGIFGKGRLNSAGVDLSDPLVCDPLMRRLEKLEAKHWSAAPTGRRCRRNGRRC